MTCGDKRGHVQAVTYRAPAAIDGTFAAHLSAIAIKRRYSDQSVALVEVYDLSDDTASILGNISTRSLVRAGANVMIGGFIVQGTAPKRVIVRAIGPEATIALLQKQIGALTAGLQKVSAQLEAIKSAPQVANNP